VGSIVDSEWLARRPAARDEAIWFFDLLQWGGVELYSQPATERLDALRRYVTPERIVPTSTGNYAEFFDALAERGDAEGVVLKRGSSKYIGSYRECASNPGWIRCKWRMGETGTTEIKNVYSHLQGMRAAFHQPAAHVTVLCHDVPALFR
jgi:ATP-dependent DNA ligase